MSDPLDRARLAVLVAGLDGSGAAEPADPVVLAEDDAARFCTQVQQDRVVGLALLGVATGSLDLPPDAVDRLRFWQRESAAVALMLERVALEALDVLDDAGFAARLLKGPALAHQVYADPSWREFGDVDLLVPADAVPAAVTALEAVGCRRLFPGLGPDWERHGAKSVTVRTAEGWEIDLHRTLASGPWGGLVDQRDLWAGLDTVDIGGRTVPTLPLEVHLAHAVVHVGLGSAVARASNLRDLVELDAAVPGDGVRHLLERWRAAGPAAQARLSLPPALRSRMDRHVPAGPIGRRERRWLGLYRRDPQPWGRLTLEALLVPGSAAGSRAERARALVPLLRRRPGDGP